MFGSLAFVSFFAFLIFLFKRVGLDGLFQKGEEEREVLLDLLPSDGEPGQKKATTGELDYFPFRPSCPSSS